MTRSVVTSACHSGRVTREALCSACVLSPIDVPPADPTPCAACNGSRVSWKLSVGAIPCHACRLPRRECHHCGGVGVVAGRPCEGVDCAARGGVR